MMDFDPTETLQAVTAEAHREAEARGVHVTLLSDAELPTALVGDEGRLRRALQLLIANAVNVTQRGTVSVAARVTSLVRDRVVVSFEVTDGGAGLLSEDGGAFPIAGDISRGENVDLALWKQTMHLLADEVGVRSGMKVGNTIWFTVEFLVDPKSASSKRRPDCRVLVVEDNLVNQKVAMRMIEKLGYSVQVVADGKAALDAMDKEAFDLILMDCQMPVMDGYAATEEIRRREGEERHTPIVALTAHAIAENRKRCLEIGMDDFVTKPVTADQLERVLENWIQSSPEEAS